MNLAQPLSNTGLLAAGISVVIIGAVSAVGSNLITTFTTVSTKLASAGK